MHIYELMASEKAYNANVLIYFINQVTQSRRDFFNDNNQNCELC